MQTYLDSVYYHEHMLDITVVCKIFGVSRSGYYAWKNRQEDAAARKQKEESENALKEKVKRIIRKLGYVPGARTLKTLFFRDFDMCISRKRCGYLLAVMHLTANRPLKDAYKHQATHDHPYATEIDNLVNRNFFVGPRKVILTDITYLYYGPNRITFYLCVFKDAYTREILGAAVSQIIDVEHMVRPAYEQMMREHGSELKQPDIYLHSDQGSQYLSTTFQELLKTDEFVQSVSGRGNSLDNSPMESLFSRMKTAILAILALAGTYETAKELTLGYLDKYTNEIYQYDLGGLTPKEFYLYVTTGVYPCDRYFGVDASKLLPIDKLIEVRRLNAEKSAEKAREKAERDRAAGLSGVGKDPMAVVNRDHAILKKLLKEWDEVENNAVNQKEFLKKLLDRVDNAVDFITCADPELKKALWNKAEWKNHKELSYIYDMRGLF